MKYLFKVLFFISERNIYIDRKGNIQSSDNDWHTPGEEQEMFILAEGDASWRNIISSCERKALQPNVFIKDITDIPKHLYDKDGFAVLKTEYQDFQLSGFSCEAEVDLDLTEENKF